MKAIVTRITYNKSLLNGYRRIAHTLLFCEEFVQLAQKTAYNSKIFRLVCLFKNLRLPVSHPFSRPFTLEDRIQSLKIPSTII